MRLAFVNMHHTGSEFYTKVAENVARDINQNSAFSAVCCSGYSGDSSSNSSSNNNSTFEEFFWNLRHL